MSRALEAIQAAIAGFVEDDCMASAAALAFYTVFSLPPLLVLVFHLAGVFGVSEQRIDQVMGEQLGIPTGGRQEERAGEHPAGGEGRPGEGQPAEDAGPGQTASVPAASTGEVPGVSPPARELTAPFSGVAGIGLLVLSATAVLTQLQRSLNRAWRVEPDPQGGWIRSFLVKRGLSLGMIAVFGGLLLLSLGLTALAREILGAVQGRAPGALAEALGAIVDFAITLTLATLMFAAIYKVLPDAELRWRDLWLGAFLTAVLFVVGKLLVGWYLQRSRVGASWGSAAASTIAVLVWVYYTSLIVLFGAELTQALVSRFGGGIQPVEGAVSVDRVPEPARPRFGGDLARADPVATSRG